MHPTSALLLSHSSSLITFNSTHYTSPVPNKDASITLWVPLLSLRTNRYSVIFVHVLFTASAYLFLFMQSGGINACFLRLCSLIFSLIRSKCSGAGVSRDPWSLDIF
eukprot:93810_1